VSGSYSVENQSAPGGLNDTAQGVQSQTSASEAAANARQADAHRFITENGASTVDGHADVGTPR
jgi:hypothetical protein